MLGSTGLRNQSFGQHYPQTKKNIPHFLKTRFVTLKKKKFYWDLNNLIHFDDAQTR